MTSRARCCNQHTPPTASRSQAGEFMGYYRQPGASRIATRPAATSASPSKSSGSPNKLWMARWMKERAKGTPNRAARPSLSSPLLSKRPTHDDGSCKTDITHTLGAFPGYQDILAHPSGLGMKYLLAQTGVWVAGMASHARANIWCPWPVAPEQLLVPWPCWEVRANQRWI